MNVAVSAVVAAARARTTGEGANRVLRMALWVTILLTAIISVVFVAFATPL